MAKLIYSAIASLDGYVANEAGDFSWAEPSEEAHAFVNDLTRPVGTHLLGRRTYEIMLFWETPDAVAGQPDVMRDFAAVWQAAEKVVYSTTLESVSTAKTRLERRFEPDAVRRLKQDAAHDLAVGGPELGAEAIRAGLVDEYQLFLAPVVVGGGHPALPSDARVDLELVDQRRFADGMVYLGYRTRA